MEKTPPKIKVSPPLQSKSSSYIGILWLILLLAAGIYVRFFDLSDPPLDFHPTRQLHSLIITRGIYFQNAPGISTDQRESALMQAQAEGKIEPPIMEWMTAQIYRMAGAENFNVGRILSIVFWIAGAILLYFFSGKYLPRVGRLAAVGFMLVLPYAVYASRAFQPDPLMTALCILSWFLFARWVNRPGWGMALVTGVVTGMTLLVKPTAVFYLVGVFLGLMICTRSYKIWRNPQAWVMLLLFALPTALYSIFVWLDPAITGDVATLRFFPSYWTKIEFYLTWYSLLDRHIGSLWIILSLLGGLNLTNSISRGIYWGGWAGYILMGFVLPHHISTHDYYILPLIPLLGIGLAGFADLTFRSISQTGRLVKWAAAGLMVVLVLTHVYQARNTMTKTDYRDEPQLWMELARQVAPLSPTAGLTPDYGLRLTYWGGISITNWFTADEIKLREEAGQSMDIAALFAEKAENAGSFLVTLPEEFDRQPDLKRILDENYTQVSSTPGIWLYDLRTKIKP